MKRLATLILTAALPLTVMAGDVLDEDDDYHTAGPSKDQIELLDVQETSPYGSDNPLQIKIANKSPYYLDRVAIRCTIYDKYGGRLFKNIIFQSQPRMSLDFSFPFVKTPEMGIPPGAIALVDLYTEDNRWMRGNGKYVYKCEIYGVSGSK